MPLAMTAHHCVLSERRHSRVHGNPVLHLRMSTIYDGGAKSFFFTKLASSFEKGAAKKYSVVVLGRAVKTYAPLPLEEGIDKETIGSLDRRIQDGNYLENLLSHSKTLILAGTDVKEDIPAPLPKVVRYPLPHAEIYRATYNFGSADIEGPRIILINGKMYPLTGWCSYPYLRAFLLNGDYYLETGSACCGCGMTAQVLFGIEREGPVIVHADVSESD